MVFITKKFIPSIFVSASILVPVGAVAGARAFADVSTVKPFTRSEIHQLGNTSRRRFSLIPEEVNPFGSSNVELTVGSVSVDDLVMALGDGANMNVLADSANLSEGKGWSSDVPVPIQHLWANSSRKFNLSFLQPSDDTVLVWKAPTPLECLELGRQLLKNPEQLEKSPDSIPRQLLAPIVPRELLSLPDDTLAKGIIEYLRESKKIEGDNYSLDLSLADVPDGLRERIIRRYETQKTVGTADYSLWLRANWGRAQFALSAPLTDNVSNPPILWLRNAVRGFTPSLLVRSSPYVPSQLGVIDFAMPAPILDSKAAELEGTQTPQGNHVRLRARGAALEDVLQEISKQSGTVIALTPEVTALNLRLTAHVRTLTVNEALDSLARLYGLQWKVNADGARVASLAPLSARERMRLRFGSSQQGFRSAQRAFDNGLMEGRKGDLGLRVVNHIGERELLAAKRKGVPFSVLPPELQQEVMVHFQDFAALRALESYVVNGSPDWNRAVLHLQNAPDAFTEDDSFSLVATLRLPNGNERLISAPPETVMEPVFWQSLPEQTKQQLLADLKRKRLEAAGKQ